MAEDAPPEFPARRTVGPRLVPGARTDNEISVRPLADRLRPTSLDDYLGQGALVGPSAPLRQLISSDRVPSILLWGPPGSGKTTLASLIAHETSADFITLSAVTSGVREVRSVIENAKVNRQYARRTVLFIDEIHRFNKAQQDAFLPHVESGLVTLIGATTENPSFSVIAPLLSRCRVFTLKPLGEAELATLLERGLADLNRHVRDVRFDADADALAAIVALSDGDGRRALGMLEIASNVARTMPADGVARITAEVVRSSTQRHLVYDKGGEEHYNLISALHKTLRSSDPHAAAYWCERMLAAGEDARFILRRLVRAAAEDVGLAEPGAVAIAVSCLEAYEKIGSPEGDIFVTQLAVYLAMAPKSNAVYRAHKAVRAEIEGRGSLPVPLHLRNAPTRLMKSEGYGTGYSYDHDAEGAFAAKQGLPDALEGTRFYEPTSQGREAALRQRLEPLDRARDEESRRRRGSDHQP
jgi:putative ATPase